MINRRTLAAESMLYVAALLVGLACVGCIAPVVPSPPDGQVDPQPAPSGAVFTAAQLAEPIARRIEVGPEKGYRHSDQLLMALKDHVASGELSQADADRLIDACPGIRDKRRVLTADDAAAVRGVK